jgi:5-methylcytosine-specific restriction endonuclease McrA
MMGDRRQRFSRKTQEAALLRQQNLCASCGIALFDSNETGEPAQEFLAGAHAHHIKHVKFGGTNHLDNCVVLCQPCHYSVHEGGNYRRGTVVGTLEDYPHYKGAIA